MGEQYHRIPWHGSQEPTVGAWVTCGVCGRETSDGIRIEHEGKTLGFCCNRHYIEWWLLLYPDSDFSPHDYMTPEERFPEE